MYQWEDKCKCGGEYKAMGMCLPIFPAKYQVICKVCCEQTYTRSLEEIQRFKEMFSMESESNGNSTQVATLLAPNGVGINTSAFRHE